MREKRPEDGFWLLRGTEVVAELVFGEPDQPWFLGTVEPKPAYAEVKPMFEEERAHRTAGDYAAAGEVSDRLNALLTLRTPEGPAAEFWLQINDDEFALRYSMTPLPR